MPIAKDIISTNIKNTNEAIKEHRQDGILFLRSIKHLMTDREYNHFSVMQKTLLKYFPNSRSIILTDWEKNTKYSKDIIYAKFSHWEDNPFDREFIGKLIKDRGLV